MESEQVDAVLPGNFFSGLLKLFLRKCVVVSIYLFVCPYAPIHVSKLLSGKCSLYAQNKAETNPL